jgi:hypothetical protein
LRIDYRRRASYWTGPPGFLNADASLEISTFRSDDGAVTTINGSIYFPYLD